MVRMEREKQLQLENATIRLQSVESEAANFREEVNRQRVRIEKLETERKELCDQVLDLRNELLLAKESDANSREQERR